jgi:hypothetical protein
MIRNALCLIFPLCLQSTVSAQLIQSPEIVKGTEANSGDVPLLLRIPARFIADSMSSDFEHTSPVNQVLLGTKSTGTSHCKGQVTCVVEDNPNGVSILCCIKGTVESKTCGTNGPAFIDSTATTDYVSSKRLKFDGKLFSCTPASVSSCTHLTIAGISSRLPGLRGRLVKHVATKRAHESNAQAEAIVGSQTEAELIQRIDAEFELRIDEMNRQFANRLSILKRFPSAERNLRLRSAKDGVEVSLGRLSHHGVDNDENRKPIGEMVELWLRRNENLVATGSVTAMLFSKAPIWLSTYFSENPMFQKPDDRKWGMEVREKWIVIRMHE